MERSEVKRTLAAVAPQCSPMFRAVLEEIAARIEATTPAREPGSDDDDPTPAWWDR